jgi:hypothetical protein
MGLPFKESSGVESTPKQFSSIQLTNFIFRTSTSTTPFDIGTGQVSQGFQSGTFAVYNENASLYNNNGGFIIRKKGNYKIEINFRMLTDAESNPSLSIKKNNSVVEATYLACNDATAVDGTFATMNFTSISKLLQLNIGDVITFDMIINNTTPIVSGHPTDLISHINIIEI